MSPGSYKFDEFELDSARFELRRNGKALKLERIPLELLILLAEKNGNVVTRQEIVDRLWGQEVFVDTEHGINTAVRKIRTALRDDAERPLYIQTVSGKGYRFVAELSNGNGSAQKALATPDSRPITQNEASPAQVAAPAVKYRTRKLVSALVACLLLVAGALLLLNVAGLRDGFLSAHQPGPIHSLAVLPLRNLSNDASQEYFTDGITDELITDLAKAGDLRVISHTSVERYKGTKLSLPEIARELGGVDAVVEGTVLRSGDRVRITAQLIDGRSDQHLWADSYDRRLRDVLSTENEVSQSIAETIRLKLSSEQKAYLAAPRPVDPEAHDAYLKGRFFWKQRGESDLKKAVASFQQAITKDPRYAPAYSGLADTYFFLGYFLGHMPPTDAMPLARTAALKAIDLDPNSAEGHASLAAVQLTYDWNYAAAEQELKHAIALNPNYEYAHHLYSALLMSTGRPGESIAEGRKAVEVDPVSGNARNMLGYLLVWNDRIDEAIQEDLKTLEIDPSPVNLGMIHERLQDSYRRKGMQKEAFEEHVKTIQAYGADAKEVARHRKIYAEKRWRGLDEDYLKQLLGDWEKDHWHFTAFQIAGFYAGLGNKDQAFAWFNKCVELRSTMMFWIDVDSGWASLRSDPRYAELKRKMAVSR